ncbi:hypothetical protein M422DRAFT_238973 [Sphaerobolus stellatus SS14]|nr:hypothetical protein M422DRAFT_238973 [Sphaerobolus stellatus SS14]
MPSKRQGPVLTYVQRKVARIHARDRHEGFNGDVDEIVEDLEERCEGLAIKWKKSKQTVLHAVCSPGRVAKKKRSVNLVNAARQVDGWLRGDKLEITEEERLQFEAIQTRLKELGGAEAAKQLLEDLQAFLIKKAEKLRDTKQKGRSLSTKAIVQDVTATVRAITDELHALNQRTGVEGFMFFSKPDKKFNFPPQVVTTEKAHCFLIHGVKKIPADLLKEFELFVVGDIEGLVMNHNERLKDTKGRISKELKAGLFEITGKELIMQYENYLKLVNDHGVALKNWPKDVLFVNPSKISTMFQLKLLLEALTDTNATKRCQWYHLSEADWEKKKEEFRESVKSKGPRKRTRVEIPDDSKEESHTEEERPVKKKKKTAKAPDSDKENQCTADPEKVKKKKKTKEVEKKETDKDKTKKTGKKKIVQEKEINA